MPRILLPVKRYHQPRVSAEVNGQWGLIPEFLWCGSFPLRDYSDAGAGWQRASTVIDTSASYGRASVFDGTVNGYTRTGGRATAQTSITFVAIYTCTSSVIGQVLLSTSSGNSGFRLNQFAGTLRFTKGNVVHVGTGIALVTSIPYVVIVSNDQASASYYMLVKPLMRGAISRDGTTTNASSVSNAGNGTYCVGRGHLGWNGSIGLAFASFNYLPEQAARELIQNPWSLFLPVSRKIYPSIDEAPPESAPYRPFRSMIGVGY